MMWMTNSRPRFCLRIVWLLFAAVSIAASSAKANTSDDYGGLNSYFHLDELQIAPDRCAATATINYDNVLSNMSKVRDEWLSLSNSTEFYQRQTLEIIYGIIDHKAGGLLLQIVYDKGSERSPNNCHFILNLEKADDFGRTKSFQQLSWDFNAALASKIVWDKFDDKNLSKIALNYKFTPEADRLLAEEHGVEPSTTADQPDHPRSCADISASDIANAFGNSPYAVNHHLHVLDASKARPLPNRPHRSFSCISKVVTNGGTLNVFVEPKLLNGKWYVSIEAIP